jgi:hypothetical protein
MPTIRHFKDAVEDGSGTTAVELSMGQVIMENLIMSYTAAAGDRGSLKPVDVGKPLSAEVRHVYTGCFPEANSWGVGSDDQIDLSKVPYSRCEEGANSE